MGDLRECQERTPVILGVGEHLLKTDDLDEALEPVDMMAAAMKAAEADAGANVLERLDTVSVIGVTSWLYKDPAALLCQRLGIAPQRQVKAGMGGEKPVRLVHEAALAIQRGEAEAVAIVGGEAQNAFRKARRAKTQLPWTERASREEAWGDMVDTTLGVAPAARAIGVQAPLHVYPLFENALSAKLGHTPTEALRHSADLWSEYARVSAGNPYAWSRAQPSPREIATISEDNRLISFPYPKWTVANDSVNQSAAVIVASYAFAKRLGVSDDRLVHFHSGAAAAEPADFLLRGRYDAYPALEATLTAAASAAGDAGAFDLTEIYSCFPVVPKAAIDVLRENGLPEGAAPTVTGGLTFFGGPLNNYMTHAICAMTRQLRGGEGRLGLLYGQGGAMTKHHALVLSASPTGAPLAEDYSAQDAAEARRTDAPPVVSEYTGAGSIETYTAFYGRDGEPQQGVVIA
ncbi:MAG: enoyl-CoA hydratase, partial [Pseudomonadota bacterium]